MSKRMTKIIAALTVAMITASAPAGICMAASEETVSLPDDDSYTTGGGYSASGQLNDVGFLCEIYDATNGLPTSDANYVMSASDGYIWIGGYSGIIRYDGSVFERLDPSEGLTSGRVIFEDDQKRIWVGTNDNGVVVLDDGRTIRYTYEDGLPSLSIRTFAQGGDGIVYIGSTAGISYVGDDGRIKNIIDGRLEGRIITRMTSDSEGVVYGCTREGSIFSAEGGKVVSYYTHDELGCEVISTIFADPVEPGKVYLGTESDVVYYGSFGDDASKLKRISVNPAENIYWITSACGRIWVTSENVAGYIDEEYKFHMLRNIPMNNSIDMMTSDYQGNLWLASSRQGVMKIVTNSFMDLTEEVGIDPITVNTTCYYRDMVYIGTDSGLYIVNKSLRRVKNSLTDYLEGARIRCILNDKEDNIWIGTYTKDLGLVCVTPYGDIKGYTDKEGMPSNKIRVISLAKDGSVLVGTNEGLVVIRDGKIERTVGGSDTITNTVFLTVCEGDNGTVYAGTDGDGIYVIGPDDTRKIGRIDGLTSDVILRIKKDEVLDVYWIITSNSIEYLKNGRITNIDSFPYNNNFDMFHDRRGNIWILSSIGVYCVKALDFLNNRITDYKLYSYANGLPGAPTANSFSDKDDKGNLYIAERSGVCAVNLDRFYEHTDNIRIKVKSIYCNNELITPGSDGAYTIPAVKGRVQITPAILDYSMTNPLINVYLEGSEDEGITAEQNKLTKLEFTDLKYGDYTLHIRVLDKSTGKPHQDERFRIVKKPMASELLIVRILGAVLVALLAGLAVWRVLTGTVITKQYEQIRRAKEDAERANSAKSRFLANMSHEIRTPINTIMGMDEMILREDAKDVPKPYFMSIVNYALDIRSASESLLGLINDLLDISKIESGKMNLVEGGYDTAELIRSLVKMIRVKSQEKDLTFDLDIDESTPKRMYGDSGKIKQVVLNLLTNAVKYTEEGGFTLKVSKEAEDEEKVSLRFSVKDTGIGVKPEDMDKLFTAYERLDEEKNTGIQGTGLGLDISRRFADLMGGRLWCESEYNNGSEFIFTVDQKIEDASPIGKFEENVDDYAKGPYVPQFVAPDADILVVDDNPMNLAVIKGLLKATQMFVTTASSGEECLEKIKYGDFNVVLLDHMMPGMDGVETVERIREDHPDLPVYALTANSTLGEDFYILKGFTGYLAKPIDSRALELAIMKHLPEEVMMKPDAEYAPEPEALPENMEWIKETEGISVDDGIKNSGGISSFISSLELFLDTLDDSASVIRAAYEEDDIRLYTVKVHALKSSARIIGANNLSELARKLEDAGNSGDIKFIDENTDRLLSDYMAYKEKLKRIKAEEGSDDKEDIPEDELKDAYSALRELIPQMDYDSVEMIVDNLKQYNLPKEDKQKIDSLEKMMKTLDWDSMAQLMETEP
ncbi:MAG: response regulator [Lachnospiraceae bacterium]|nr:response regulator [Lachnospiraceae bacterium]